MSDEINYNNPDYHQTNAESLAEHTVQADYVQPIGKITMEAGLKGIFRKNKSDFQYLTKNALTGNYDLSLNYRFGKLKEEIKTNKRGIKNDDLSH